MPNKFCLTKEDTDKFKAALRTGKELDPQKLMEMSSDERREAFGKVLGEDNAKGVNSLFEEKLLLKNQQQGFKTWAKTVAGVKPAVRRDMVAKIEKLDKVLTPADERRFLKDLAAQKLGVDVSYDEVQEIAKHTSKLKELSTGVDAKGRPVLDGDGKPIETKTKFGNPTLEYFKELDATKKYVQSLNEKSVAEHLVSIARNFLLASVKTPLKVTVEQTLNQGIEGLARAFSFGKGAGFMGANPKLVYDYIKEADKVYRASNYNQASMNSLTEGNMFGDIFSHHEGQSGYSRETGLAGLKEQGLGPSAKGLLRQGAKGLDRVVIHYLHGVVFNAHFNAAFADFANRESTRIARSEGLSGAAQKARAVSLFTEATTIGTVDPIAAKIRAEGQQDAMRVTNTNITIGSKWGAGVKAALNSVSGPLKVGDWTVPFSKIPGSIFSNAVDVAGGGIPRALWQFKKAVNDGQASGKYNFQQPIRTLLRTVGGLAAAAILAAFIPKEKFDEKRGMIKIGGAWVSTELLGPIGPALTGFLEARDAPPDKQHKWMNEYYGIGNYAYNYGKGVLKGAWHLPGINEVKEISDYGLGDYLKNFITSRIAPSIVADSYRAYQAGNPLPVLAGAKIKTDAQIRSTDKDRFDATRVSPGALEAQTKHARFTKEMDMIESGQAQGVDTSDLKDELRDKLERTKTPLTEAEAARANKILGTDEYKAEITDEEAAAKPKFDKYNKNADGIIDRIVGWARAIGTDPLEAFDKLAKGETFKRMENGTVVVERMDEKGPGGSESMRRKLGGGGKDVKLDHTVPLEIGGTNDPSNLKLVTTEEWESYTPVENYLAGALHDGKVTGVEAQKMILAFKNGSMTKRQIADRVGEPMEDIDGGLSTGRTTTRGGIKAPGLRMPSLHLR